MKRVLLTLVLFIGGLVFGQDTVENIGEVGVYKATVYHDNGEIAQTGFMTPDKKVHGIWKSYDTKGNLKSLGEYDNGKKVGVWIFWDTSYAVDKYSYTRVEYGTDSMIAQVNHSNEIISIADTENEIEE